MNNTMSREIIEIPVEEIIPNRFQPRLTFDVEALNELANSIKEHGIIQPLVVRRIQDKFEIIAGERRYKAATLVGMKKVPCIVMNLNDNESAEVAVIENIKRKEMTSLEEAKSFKKILDKGYLTQDELAKRMGKSQSSIANKLRLLNLDELVQDAILNGKISERHARSILKLDNKEDQRKVLSEIIEKRLTVRQTDDLIRDKYGKDTNMQIKESEYLSTPEINIPINNIINDINPQANLINNLGKFTQPQEIKPQEPQQMNRPTPNSSLDIFRYDTPNIQEEHSKEQDIQSVINPQVFSNTATNGANNMNIDINAIKTNAENIRQEQPIADMSSLMQNPNPKNNNKFFVDLDMKDDIIDVMNNNASTKVKTATDALNKSINDLKLQGINVYKEEMDLGNTYQITIRIDK